jgi:hypothetical protein
VFVHIVNYAYIHGKLRIPKEGENAAKHTFKVVFAC